MCGVSLCMSAVSSNESSHHLCFSLRLRAQQREKRLSDSSVLGQKEPKNNLFWFLLLYNLMAKIDSKHKTQECPSKVPVERLKAQTLGGWLQEDDLSWKTCSRC